MSKRVVVLGAGVTGEAFVAALRRLEPDAEVTVVEHELVGGECSYWACIPSKTLLRPLEVRARARLAPGAATTLGEIDVAAIFDWRDQQAGKDDTSQVEWLSRLGAQLVRGTGQVEPGLVRVNGRELPYDHLLLATGSLPATPPVEGLADLEHWGSREATSAREVPETMIIVGGGAVGCELAQFYGRLGTRVALVQNGEHLLPRMDPEAADILADVLRDEGVELRLGAHASRVSGGGGAPYRLELEDGEALEAERLLVATGRRPNLEGVDAETLGLTVERSGVRTDERLRAADGIWAAGDVTGIALFTHVGKYQARVAAANVAGQERPADYSAIPSAVFTDPQVASAGDTSGEGAVVSRWKLETVSRTGTFQKPKRPGLVKLYADPERKVLVGATAVGPEAGEWLGQLTLAIRARVPVDVLRDTIQPFPTFSEAIFFAARDLDV